MVRLRLIWRFRILPGTVQGDPELLCAPVRGSVQIGQRDDADDSREDNVVVSWITLEEEGLFVRVGRS